jgi:hypothetical protein
MGPAHQVRRPAGLLVNELDRTSNPPSGPTMARPYLSAALLSLVALLLSLAACDDDVVGPGADPDPGEPDVGVTAVIVTPGDLELYVGTQEGFSAEVQGGSGVSQNVTWATSDPEVATVTSDGQVSGVAPGTATITAASQADPSVSGEATVQVVCQDPVIVSSAVSADETWSAQGGGCVDYIVTDAYDVRATLSIDPGTVVAFERDAGLRVEAGGALIADGTPQAPIRLTGTEAERGWWSGIHLRRSDREENLFNHVTIEYGGQNNPFNQYDPGFALRIGEPAAASGLADNEGRFATITNTTLRQSAGYGLFIRGSAQVDFANNRITENALGAARMPLHVADVLDEGTDFSGNDLEIVMLTHSAAGDVSLVHPGGEVRYRFGRPGNDPDGARIAAGGTLSIAPGVVMEFTERSDLTITESGSLLAEGTSTEPITLTGVESAAGSWGGLTLDGSSNAVVRHAVVEYGGYIAGANLALASGATATVTESVFRHAGPNQFGSDGYGLRVTSSSQVNDDACQVNTFDQNAAGDCRID